MSIAQRIHDVCHLEGEFRLRTLGATVTTAVCVIDRESGGPAKLAELGIELRALLTATQLRVAAVG